MKAAIASSAWLAAGIPAWLRFNRALAEPAAVQAKILRDVIARNEDCVFGRTHGFSGIRNYERFCERVPLSDYPTMEPWIARIMRGERSVLTTEPVKRLLPTSGTASGRKLIPFTASFQRELNAAVGPWIVDIHRRHPGALSGPMYWSISPAMPADEIESAVPVGFDDDSAYVGKWRRWFVEGAFAVPSAVRLAGDFEALRYLTLLCLLRQRRMSLASVWHPSFLVLLLDALPAWWDDLVRDVESGCCSRAGDVPAESRRAFRVPPNPRRAAELRQAGCEDAHVLWPELRVVSCWADAQAALPAAAVQRRLPHAHIQAKGLLATEAVVTIPFAGRQPVAVTSHFFEFADEHGELHLAHELQPGVRYSVIVTTGAGLWRYPLGDCVEVTGFVGRTPSLRFLGRIGSASDVCGEKLDELFATAAITAACVAFGVSPEFAMLAPEFPHREAPRYTLFIEPAAPLGIALRIEQELRRNPHYALCRDLGQLGPVVVCEITRGGHAVFCKVMNADGQRLGDIKPQSLSPRSDWRELFGEMPS